MIHFEGVQEFQSPVDVIFARLADAGFLARCLPDAEVSEGNPDRAAWKVRPKLAFISGAIDTTATVMARAVNGYVRYRMESKSVGAGSIVDAQLDFLPKEGGGTQVKWTGDIVTLSGLMKLAPKALIQGTAQKIIADIWAAIHPKIEGEATPSPEAPTS